MGVGDGFSVGEDDCAHDEPEVDAVGGGEVLGAGVPVGGFTGQVDGVVLVLVLVPVLLSVLADCVGVAALEAAGEGTAVAGVVPEAFAVTLVWVGFAPASAVGLLDGHPLLAVACAVLCDFPDAMVPIRPPGEADEPPAAGVALPPLAWAPLPSVPALPRGVPPPPLSEELA